MLLLFFLARSNAPLYSVRAYMTLIHIVICSSMPLRFACISFFFFNLLLVLVIKLLSRHPFILWHGMRYLKEQFFSFPILTLEFIVCAQSYCNRNSNSNSDAFLFIGGPSSYNIMFLEIGPLHVCLWAVLHALCSVKVLGGKMYLTCFLVSLLFRTFRSQTDLIPILFFIVQL